MEVEQGGSVREDRIDVDFFDVRQVRDRVLGHLEVSHVLDGAVVLSDLVEFLQDLVEGVPLVPHRSVDAF